jgi:hypothetical protein
VLHSFAALRLNYSRLATSTALHPQF